MDVLHEIKRREMRKAFFCSIGFAFFYFALTTIFAIQDLRINRSFGAASHAYFHYLKVFSRAAGLLSFSLSRRIFKGETARKILLFMSFVVFFLSMLCLYLPGTPLLIICPFTSSLSLGYLWGAYIYFMAMMLTMNAYIGKAVGFGYAAGVVLQVILQNFLAVGENIFFIVITMVIFAAITYIIARPPADWVFENPMAFALESPEWRGLVKRQIVTAVLLTVIMNLLCIGFDVYFTISFANSNVELYGTPRLFFALSYIIAGMLADIKKGGYYVTALLPVFLLSVFQLLMPFLPSYQGTFLSIYYFYAAFYVLFTVLPFLTLSVRSDKAALISPLGLCVSDLMEATASMIIYALYGTDGARESSGGTFLLSALALLTLIALLYFMLRFSGFDFRIMPDEKDYSAFLALFPFTPREREVAYTLLSTEKPMKELALDFNISERSLYRYTRSIYDKSGTVNRTDFVRKYYETRKSR